MNIITRYLEWDKGRKEPRWTEVKVAGSDGRRALQARHTDTYTDSRRPAREEACLEEGSGCKTHHSQRPDRVVEEDDGGSHEHGDSDESPELDLRQKSKVSAVVPTLHLQQTCRQEGGSLYSRFPPPCHSFFWDRMLTIVTK